MKNFLAAFCCIIFTLLANSPLVPAQDSHEASFFATGGFAEPTPSRLGLELPDFNQSRFSLTEQILRHRFNFESLQLIKKGDMSEYKKVYTSRLAELEQRERMDFINEWSRNAMKHLTENDDDSNLLPFFINENLENDPIDPEMIKSAFRKLRTSMDSESFQNLVDLAQGNFNSRSDGVQIIDMGDLDSIEPRHEMMELMFKKANDKAFLAVRFKPGTSMNEAVDLVKKFNYQIKDVRFSYVKSSTHIKEPLEEGVLAELETHSDMFSVKQIVMPFHIPPNLSESQQKEYEKMNEDRLRAWVQLEYKAKLAKSDAEVVYSKLKIGGEPQFFEAHHRDIVVGVVRMNAKEIISELEKESLVEYATQLDPDL